MKYLKSCLPKGNLLDTTVSSLSISFIKIGLSYWWNLYSSLVVKLSDYSDACILVKVTITVSNTGTAATPNNRNKKVTLTKYAPFTDRIREINSTEIGHAKDMDVVIPVYHLMKYSEYRI